MASDAPATTRIYPRSTRSVHHRALAIAVDSIQRAAGDDCVSIQSTAFSESLRGGVCGRSRCTVHPDFSRSRLAQRWLLGHWCRAPTPCLTKLCNEWSKKEKVDLKIDYFLIRAQARPHRLHRGAGEVGPRYSRVSNLVRVRSGQQPGTGRRHHGDVDRQQRRGPLGR